MMKYSNAPRLMITDVLLYDGRQVFRASEMDDGKLFGMLDMYQADYGEDFRNYVQGVVMSARSGSIHSDKNVEPPFEMIDIQKYALRDNRHHAVIFKVGIGKFKIQIGQRGMSLLPARTVMEIPYNYI